MGNTPGDTVTYQARSTHGLLTGLKPLCYIWAMGQHILNFLRDLLVHILSDVINLLENLL